MEEIKEYDNNGNLIYRKFSDGFECWRKYDNNKNCIYYKDSDGFESEYIYDNNKLIEIRIC